MRCQYVHTSSRLISSLLNVSPGITPRFFSQKMAANDPEKKIPSTAANATSRSAYGDFLSSIHLNAHSAFFLTQGMVSIALNRFSLPQIYNNDHLWNEQSNLLANILILFLVSYVTVNSLNNFKTCTNDI